jgi:hypothetical protein
MLVYAGICWYMLVYAGKCWYKLVYAGICWYVLVYDSLSIRPCTANAGAMALLVLRDVITGTQRLLESRDVIRRTPAGPACSASHQNPPFSPSPCMEMDGNEWEWMGMNGNIHIYLERECVYVLERVCVREIGANLLRQRHVMTEEQQQQ